MFSGMDCDQRHSDFPHRSTIWLWPFEALLDPGYASHSAADDCHTRPEIPVLFQISAGTKHGVAGKEMNLCAKVEQTEDDQEEGAYSSKPLFHLISLQGRVYFQDIHFRKPKSLYNIT